MSAFCTVLAQLARYILVGGFAFVIDFGLFSLCLYGLGWQYLLANLMGLVAGLCLNYALSISWVFRSSKHRLEKCRSAEFAVFTLVGLMGVGLNELLMLLMVGFFSLHELYSKMIAAVVVLMWNFCARKLILFNE